MRRVGVAAAGVALGCAVACATGDVGGEGHVLLLSGHHAGRSVHSMRSRVASLLRAALATSLAEESGHATADHHSPFHQRCALGLRQLLAGHQPMLGGGPLCHVVMFVPFRKPHAEPR